MTLRERCIVEAYTGYVMTQGDERDFFYKYIAEKIGRPVWTHELACREGIERIQKACKDDFVALCAQSDDGWFPCNTEQLPKEREEVLITRKGKNRVSIAYYSLHHGGWYDTCFDHFVYDVSAWQPLPDKYKEGENDG